jgi:hypothetical protein
MQGSTIATKNVAYCSMAVNSTTGWDLVRYGGEDWIRTRGCVSPEDRALLAHKVRISSICGKRRVHTEESGRLHGAGPCRCEPKVSFLSSVRIAQCHLLRIVLHVASGFLLGSSMFLDGSLGARDCGLSEVGFLLSHEPQLATPANLAQEIWTHNERREQ